MKKWCAILVPRDFKYGEFIRIKRLVSNIYGYELSEWQFIAYLLRFYVQKTQLFKTQTRDQTKNTPQNFKR